MTDYIKWIRSRVGTRKIILVFGVVVVTDDNGRILFQQRTDFDFWGLPGGVMELDEDIATCARREVREETGLEVGDLHLVGIYSDPRYDVVYPNGDQVQQFAVCFTAQAAGGNMQVDGVESSAQRFFAADEAVALPLPVWYQEMVRDAINHQKTAQLPVFLPPLALPETQDQIAQIRPYVGNSRFIGVGATAVVQRDDGRVLMIQRADNGRWIFPAGYSDLGENVAYTAVRETREETGLEIVPQRILGIYSSPRFHHTYANGHQMKNVGPVFLAHPVGGSLKPDPAEVADWAWVAPADVGRRAAPIYRQYYERTLVALNGGAVVID